MNYGLKTRHWKALSALRSECEYEDSHKGGTENFILRGALPARTGEKTLQDLIAWGLVTSGPNRWHDDVGYRITEKGIEIESRKGSPDC